jgi:PPIC-type PPIASE domain
MNRLLREPLLHFFVLGAALFWLYGWVSAGRSAVPNEIVVSRGQLTNLKEQFERVWQRPPSAQELQGLVDGWVHDEIYYREGLAMGLDRDDPVVRRRIGLKVQFIVDGAIPAPPTDEQLQTWLNARADTYRIQPSFSLQQIYFDPSRHANRFERALSEAHAALNRGRRVAGDWTALPSSLDGTGAEVARVFGTDFERALESLPVGTWVGPVKSAFGLHLVRLDARQPGRSATLAEVREAVERDWLHARAQESMDASYERLRSSYVVRIDGSVSPAG